MTEENQQAETNQASAIISEEDWLKKEHGEVLAYCSRNFLEISEIIQTESAVLPPFVAVWLAKSKTNNQKFWIITGDVPHDHIPGGNAKNARDAIRHFSLRWQLKAENIVKGQPNSQSKPVLSETQKEFAELLVSRANSLYMLSEKEELWLN